MKFPSNLNCDGKTVSETGPWLTEASLTNYSIKDTETRKNGCHFADTFNLLFFNTLWPRQNSRHFEDDIFKRIFFNENVWILIKISLKFVPKGPINKIPALFQIMAWCRPGDKPLSEAMLVSLLTHKCVTRPQWVNEKQCFKQSPLAKVYPWPSKTVIE